MNKWFTVEKIDADTFAVSEYRHWEETHCYLLLGMKQAILIDTGLGISNIKTAVRALTQLPITVVTTHVHWDHIGGHKYFDNIAVHELEKDWISTAFPIPLQTVKRNVICKPCDFPQDFNIDNYKVYQGVPQKILHNGELIDIGGRRLLVVHTPGHSPGHCCFYEPDRKYLYSGDLVYKGCLDAFYPTTDPQMFLQSLRKIKAFDIKRVLPAHHRLCIPVSMIDKIEGGFTRLEAAGLLNHGKGIFDFGEFQIHI